MLNETIQAFIEPFLDEGGEMIDESQLIEESNLTKLAEE